jgi:hypothetical protein
MIVHTIRASTRWFIPFGTRSPPHLFSQAVSDKIAGIRGRPTLELFREVLVHQRYVTSPDDSKLIEGAIKGLMRGLDPHSE